MEVGGAAVVAAAAVPAPVVVGKVARRDLTWGVWEGKMGVVALANSPPAFAAAEYRVSMAKPSSPLRNMPGSRWEGGSGAGAGGAGEAPVREGVKQWGWGLLRAELKLRDARWELEAEEAEERKARAAAERMAVEEGAAPAPPAAVVEGAATPPTSLMGVVAPDTSSKVSSSQEWSPSCSSTRGAAPALLPLGRGAAAGGGAPEPWAGRARLVPRLPAAEG